MWPGMEPKSIEVDRSCPVHAACLDRVLRCTFQKQSAVLSLVGPSSGGSREASTEFSWAIEFNVLFEWFKSTAKLRFQVRCSVCSTRSWLGKWLKLSQKTFFCVANVNCVPLWMCATAVEAKGESALLSTAFWLELRDLVENLNACL